PEPLDIGLLAGGYDTASVLGALRRVREARLLAVWGEDAETTRALAAKHDTEAFPSLRKVLEVRALDLVIVASPPGQRTQDALAAMRAGKSVLVYPPLDPQSEYSRLGTLTQPAGVRVQMAATARHHPAVAALRKAIARGALGEVAMVRYSLRLSAAEVGEALAAEVAQGIDLASFLAGRPPARVFAADRGEPGRYRAVHLVLADNVIATVDVHVVPPDARGFPPRERLVAVGTKGTRRGGTYAEDKLIHSGDEPLAGHAAMLRRMTAHVRGGPPPAPAAEWDAMVRACVAADLSAKGGQPVALAPGEDL
ncbi:MAG: Gfo/Idh/MocA family protein, partial [bacterium]